MTQQTPTHCYRGARALVLLHERYLREFLAVWRRARATNVPLPETSDPCYASLESLLVHILRSAGGYMTWMCEQLGLPDPGVAPPPSPEHMAEAADAYLEHVIERWRTPLADVPEARFEDRAYTSRWGVPFSIDAMLEHAVMHPIRHSFQLSNLLEEAPPARPS